MRFISFDIIHHLLYDLWVLLKKLLKCQFTPCLQKPCSGTNAVSSTCCSRAGLEKWGCTGAVGTAWRAALPDLPGQQVTSKCYWDLPLLQKVHIKGRVPPQLGEKCLLPTTGMKWGQRVTAPAETVRALLRQVEKPRLSLFSGKLGAAPSCMKCVISLFSRVLSSLRCLFQTLSSPTDFIPLRYSHTPLSRCAVLCHLYVAYNVSERSLAFLIRHHAILKTSFFYSKLKV